MLKTEMYLSMLARVTFLDQFHRQIDRRDHAIGTRDSFAGDVERGAMIRTRPRERQPERHIHAAVKGVEFQRNQTLIVIHAEHGVEFAFGGAMENGIWRKGTDDSRFSILDSRLYL